MRTKLSSTRLLSPSFQPLNLPTFLVHCGVATDGEEEFIEAAPEGEPAGVTVAFAHQEATEAGEVAEEVSDCRQLSFAERGEHL